MWSTSQDLGQVYKGSNDQRLVEMEPKVLEENSENSRWIFKSGVDNLVGEGRQLKLDYSQERQKPQM